MARNDNLIVGIIVNEQQYIEELVPLYNKVVGAY